MELSEKPLTFAPPATAKKKEKQKHVHSQEEASAGATLMTALLAGRSAIPDRFLRAPEEADGALRKGAKPQRVSMLTYGHREILYSEMFGIRWGYSSNQPVPRPHDSPRVWVIDGREPIRVNEARHGEFFAEDVYLVMRPDGDAFSVALWVGARAAAVKQGVGAVRACQLALCLGGHARITREDQGAESEPFARTFGDALRYNDGRGTAYGFRRVRPQPRPRRLFRLRAEEADAPVAQVVVDAAQVNASDAYVLLARGRVFAWWPPGARTTLAARAIVFAQELRTAHRCRRDVISRAHPDFGLFWKELGLEMPCDGPRLAALLRENGERMKEPDEDAEPDEEGMVPDPDSVDFGVVFAMVRRDGKPKLEQVKTADDPLERGIFDTHTAYIVDCDTQMFVWKGKKAGKLERRLISKCAEQLIAQYERPSWTAVQEEFEGAETPVFRFRLANDGVSLPVPMWKTKLLARIRAKKEGLPLPQPSEEEEKARQARRIAEHDARLEARRRDADRLREIASKMAREEDEVRAELEPKDKTIDIDYTSRDYSVTDVWLMTGLEPKFARVADEDKGTFYSGNGYMVLNRMWDSERDMWIHNIYFWRGADCGPMWYPAAMLGFLPSLRRRLNAGSRCKIIERVVDQQREPPEFLSIFDDKIIIHRGAFDDEEPEVSLYQMALRGSSLRVVEVEPRGDMLDHKDCFALLTEKQCFIWIGRECPEIARIAALHALPVLEGDRDTVVFDENVQYNDFWDNLGGWRKSLHYLPEHANQRGFTRLWACSLAAKGLTVEEVRRGTFGLGDFDPQHATIIDAWNCLYVWAGSECLPALATAALRVSGEYAALVSKERNFRVSVERIVAGREPLALQKLLGASLRSFGLLKMDPRTRTLLREKRDPLTGRRTKDPEEIKHFQMLLKSAAEAEGEEEEEEEEDEDEEEDEEAEEEAAAAAAATTQEKMPIPSTRIRVVWEKVSEEHLHSASSADVALWPAQRPASPTAAQEADDLGCTEESTEPEEEEPEEPEGREVEESPLEEEGMRHPDGALETGVVALTAQGAAAAALRAAVAESQAAEDRRRAEIAAEVERRAAEQAAADAAEDAAEMESEQAQQILPCDYCGEEVMWGHMRSTPMLADRAAETNGICRNCWAKMVDTQWPTTRAAQRRAEKTSPSTTEEAEEAEEEEVEEEKPQQPAKKREEEPAAAPKEKSEEKDKTKKHHRHKDKEKEKEKEKGKDGKEKKHHHHHHKDKEDGEKKHRHHKDKEKKHKKHKKEDEGEK